MNKRMLHRFTIFITFLLIIFFFFIYHLLGEDQGKSVLENRKLSMRPDLTLQNLVTGEYSTRFEQYYNDQFPLRDQFIELNARMNKEILKQNIKDDVYMSDSGYLLTQVEEQSPADAKKVAKKVNAFADKMKNKGISVYTALMPNKSTMMEEEFPKYFPSFGQKNMDLLYKELNENTNPIDSRAILKKHMSEDNMFFYTDHHWQGKAAFYAYQNVMAHVIKGEKLNEEVTDYDDYEWSLEGKPFYGSDARKTTSVNAKRSDRIVVSEFQESGKPVVMKWGTKSRKGLYEKIFLDMEERYTNRYQAYLGGDYAQLLINNPNKKSGSNVLVIKDSYANAFIQFLVPHYNNIHVVDLRHYKKMSLEKFAVKNNVDHIIILNNINSIFVTPSLTDFENPGQGENQ